MTPISARWRVCLAVLLATTVLSACGGDDSTQPTPPETAPTPTDPTPAPQMRCAP
jgi:ABC-type glycerol-3-phosphate transport system substrate-binding protein